MTQKEVRDLAYLSDRIVEDKIMAYAVVKESISTIYEFASRTMEKDGKVLSSISDEGLHGMLLKLTGEEENGYYPVRTFYGYTGYVPVEDVCVLDEAAAKAWEASELRVVGGVCVDVVSVPKVQGVRLITLFRGSMVKVLQWESEEEGWAQVQLADGRCGYMRNEYLWEKKFSQAGVWTGEPVQRVIGDEEQFRKDVVCTAKKYLGTQYRWGGRSTAGIDCSGLTSTSYMLNGILTYRDAKIMEGYPVHEIPKEEMKPGDLVYFPGHIGMYLGDGLYIHSTGKVNYSGVVINSFEPGHQLFRQDLLEKWYATGSIF